MAEDVEYRFRTPDGKEHTLPAGAPLYAQLPTGSFVRLSRLLGVSAGLAGAGGLAAVVHKPRGRRPQERRRVIEQMRTGIKRGRYTLLGLREMKQAALEVEFEAHHETVEAALREIQPRE